MSKADNTTEDYRNEGSSERRALLGMLRLMVPTITRTGRWVLTGVRLLLGKQETVEANLFPGIGIFFRPPIGANSESIVGYTGAAAENATVIATRDEDTRKKIVAALGCNEGEGLVFNDLVAIKFTRSGQIQCWVIGGPAPVRLALASDVDAVASAHNGHQHPVVVVGGGSGTANAVLPADRAPAAVGSSAIRG